MLSITNDNEWSFRQTQIICGSVVNIYCYLFLYFSITLLIHRTLLIFYLKCDTNINYHQLSSICSWNMICLFCSNYEQVEVFFRRLYLSLIIWRQTVWPHSIAGKIQYATHFLLDSWSMSNLKTTCVKSSQWTKNPNWNLFGNLTGWINPGQRIKKNTFYFF